MKRFLILALVIKLSAGAVIAQNNDTIKAQQLNEVVIKASYNTADARGLKFTPTSKQKNSSQNGIDLLRRMAIPQIKVSLSDDRVTTQSGEPVAIFINYVAASSQELEGLKTSDVRRVEYFYSPSDQRFMGERNVVNIIIQAYEYGGYTKFSLYEKFLLGLSDKASVYSKFSYKKLTYDMYVGSDNINSRHQGTSIVGIFHLPQSDGSTSDIVRSQTLQDSRYSSNTVPISFRVSYSKRNFQTKNTIGFIFRDIPHNNTSGTLEFRPLDANYFTYTNTAKNRMKSLSYSGSFNINFPNQFALSLTPKVNYSHTNQQSNYMATSITYPIINNAKEAYYNASIMAMGRKIISDVHYIFIRGFGGYNHYNVTYLSDTQSRDRLRERYFGISGLYGYYADNISADMLIGLRNEHNTVNGESMNTLYPFVNASIGWSPNQKNSLNLSFSYSKEPMDANLKSPNIIQQNELMYYTGNPRLKNSPNIMTNLNYNWMPADWIQISPFVQHYSCFDREIPIYMPYMDGKAVIRKYENNGDHHRTQIGLSLTAYFLERNLQVQLAPSQMFYKSTGYYNLSYNPIIFAGVVTYYLRDFYFSGYYELQNRTLWTNSGTFFKDKSLLQIVAGWNKSDLNIRIGILNPFRKSWVASTTTFDTPVYSQSSINYGTSAHCNLIISATYTFGYGKKVSRNNEVAEQSVESTAILK